MTLTMSAAVTTVDGEHREMTECAECTRDQVAKLCHDLNAPHGGPVDDVLLGTELVDLIEWQMRMEREGSL